MNNSQLASAVLESCWHLGVREVVLCAGARNAPFVNLLSRENPFRVYPFFEERSAAFFALGRMLATGRPVAVLTTSGTAAAELLPATIEADYQGLPLILITADRPAHYRGSGAPQTINQIGLFSHYVEKAWDFEGEAPRRLECSRRRPLHLNVCFDEPLLDVHLPSLSFADEEFIADVTFPEPVTCAMQRPLILVGGLAAGAAEALLPVLRRWQRPLYLEAPSNLRGHPALAEFEILGGETLGRLKYDGVIRIGSIPTVRLWRELEKSALPVLHFSALPFSGLPRERTVFSLASVASMKTEFVEWDASERAADRAQHTRELQILEKYPLSEPSMVRWLSRQIPQGGRVLLGNSLPIREWDFAADRARAFRIFANRGVNGIDGLVSTFLGLAVPDRSNWGVIGDLSLLYDLSGLWPASQMGITDLNLVVINNGGGKIFERMFRNPLFECRHDLEFSAMAKMWNWQYLRIEQPVDLGPASAPRLLEVRPCPEQTEKFWSECQ